MKRNEFVNWRTHPTLNDVTKMAIDYFEHNYEFDQYLEDRSKKDTKFENPLEKEEDEAKKKKKGEEGEEEEEKDDGSEFSFSDEDEEMSHPNND